MNILDLKHRFLQHCTLEKNLQPSTLKGLKMSIEVFARRSGIANMNEINEATLRDFFYQGVEKYQWKPKTYHGYWGNLKRFLDWCTEKDYFKVNPILAIKKQKLPKSLPRRLRKEDAEKFLYTSFNYSWRYQYERSRNYTMIALLLYTGLRASETLNLKITDINLNTKTILVYQGKGKKDRIVPIYHKLGHILKSYLIERKRLNKESEYLFTGVKSNQSMLYKDLYRIFKKVSKASGVKATPHQLRHTFASEALDNGLGIYKLSQILGHNGTNTTIIYLSLAPSSLARSLDSIELF